MCEPMIILNVAELAFIVEKQEVYRDGEQTQGTWGHKRYFLYISDFMEIWINRSSGKGRGDNEEKKRRKRFLVEIYTG